ncbi:hypothetical protein OY671_009755 [Metschnikowia pulcherrima]|nr:hypothetical protein OY671_009755 [Metschnikowia pulcherrima]
MHEQEDLFVGMGRLSRGAGFPSDHVEQMAEKILEKHAAVKPTAVEHAEERAADNNPESVRSFAALVSECQVVSAAFRADISRAQRVAGAIHTAQRRSISTVIGSQALGFAGSAISIWLVWRAA